MTAVKDFLLFLPFLRFNFSYFSYNFYFPTFSPFFYFSYFAYFSYSYFPNKINKTWCSKKKNLLTIRQIKQYNKSLAIKQLRYILSHKKPEWTTGLNPQGICQQFKLFWKKNMSNDVLWGEWYDMEGAQWLETFDYFFCSSNCLVLDMKLLVIIE